MLLALGLACGEAMGACTAEAGNAAAQQDDAIGRSSGWRGWAPRTWMAWCRGCGGTVSNGTCVGAKLDGGGGSGSSAASTGNAAVDAAQRVMAAGNFNTPQNAAMTAGAGLATGFAVAAIQGLFTPAPPPSAQALAQQAAARQEQIRLQQEAAERRRLEEEEKQRRLLSSLRGYQGGVGDLKPRVESTGAPVSNVALIRRDGAASGISALTPFGAGSVTPDQAIAAGENLALLRRGDRVEAHSALEQLANAAAQPLPTAGLPFDNGATVRGGLPPAPPTPEGKPVGPSFTLEDLNKPGPKPRAEVTAVLKDAMEANQGAASAVKKEIARLESGPNKDPAKIAEEKAKLERIETEKKSIEEKQKKVEESKDEMVDLSIGQAEVSAAPGKPE